MEIKPVMKSQYHAALAMLQEAVQKCPEHLWDAETPENRFWQVAYHALFYTHLYLQPREADFTPWKHHRPDYHSMGHPSGEDAQSLIAYSRDEILAYLAFCRLEVDTQIEAVVLEQESGFYWLPFNKLELQFYNIRHIQHHAGELYERLGVSEQIHAQWVGKWPNLLNRSPCSADTR